MRVAVANLGSKRILDSASIVREGRSSRWRIVRCELRESLVRCPFIEEKLNALGITTFRQVANMTPELEDQVNTAIEFFPGRVRRDKWAKQAEDLDN